MKGIRKRLAFSFLCIVFLLLIQGVLAYQNIKTISDIQQRAYAHRLRIDDLKIRLADARLLVFKLVGTVNPSEMDLLKGQFVKERAHLETALAAEGIDKAIIEDNFATYARIIGLQYDFRFRTARALINGASKRLHESLFDELRDIAQVVQQGSERRIQEAYGQTLQLTLGILIAALVFAAVLAVLLARTLIDRQQAQLEIEKSEKKYRNIFNNAVEGFFQSTPEGRFIDVNPAFAKMLGYDSPAEIVSGISDIATEYYVDARDRDRYQAVLKQEGIVDDMEFRVRKKDGSALWVSNSTRAYFDENGTIARYEGIVNDISERKKAEEEKEQLQAQLVQAGKMEAIGTLAGGIAHDFNNILASIIGFTELALEDAEDGSPLQASLKEVYTAGMRARDLVKQILTFARRSEKTPRPVPIQQAAEEAVGFLRSTLPASIDIRLDLHSDASVMGDATQIQQLFLNLCTNAAQAMADEGGVLTIRVTEEKLDESQANELPGLNPGRHVEISVSDTGQGISEEHLDSIFEPYFTTKGLGEGTGLGLAVVHGIVKSYGGDISVESEVERGTRFRVYLPAVETQANTDMPVPQPRPGMGERILFVDDEASIAKMGRAILEKSGYDVTAVSDSMEALALFRGAPEAYDLVVTDMTMPQMNGDRLAREILKIRPGVPILLLTGYSRQITDSKAAEIGIQGFAMKPLDRLKLTRLVRTLLDDAAPDRA